MHKVWSGTGELRYYLSGSPIKFKGHAGKTSTIWPRLERFRTITLIWFEGWLWNDVHSLYEHARGATLFSEVIHQISRSHEPKNLRLRSDLAKITRTIAAMKSPGIALFISTLSHTSTKSLGIIETCFCFQNMVKTLSRSCHNIETV